MSEFDTSSFGSVLRFFRQRKHITQKKLAKELEVHENSISLWEREELAGPESHNVVLKIAEILALNKEDKRFLIEARYGTASILPLYNLPLEQNPYFTGKDSLLQQLHELLMTKKQVPIKQAISGLGGIGKTQVALEYAYRYKKSYDYVLWTQADSYESLTAAFINLAKLLYLPERNDQDQNRIVAAVKDWLRTHKRWLLILDNIEDLDLSYIFVPSGRQGAVLLTTQRQVTDERIAQAIVLDIMTKEEGALFLLRRVQLVNTNTILEATSSADTMLAREISHVLEGLPLALDQAGAYILETGCGMREYLDLCQQRQSELLKRRGAFPSDHPDSVFATFSLSFNKVEQTNSVAADILRLCVFLSPDAIPEEIFIEKAHYPGSQVGSIAHDHWVLNEAIEILKRYSLIQRNTKEKVLSVHRLVQAVLKDMMDAPTARLWAERAVMAVSATFPQDTAFENWPRCQRCLSHAQVCAALIQQEDIISAEAALLLNQAGCYLYERAHYGEAEELFENSFSLRKQIFGTSHHVVALSLHNLANLYHTQGNYPQAESRYLSSLAIWEQLADSEHLHEYANTLSGLALLYRKQGNYASVESLYQRALAIHEQTNHPDIARDLHRLGNFYWEQGRYAQAEPLYQRALNIREQLFGPNHPDVAESLTDLASLYQVTGNYQQAEVFYQQALSLWEQTLGLTHPNIAFILNNLAHMYQALGQHEKRKPLLQRALAIREETLVPDHPDIAESLSGLASLYCDQAQYEEAEPLLWRALAIREKALGPGHLLSVISRNNLVILYAKQEKYIEIELLYQRALQTLKQTPEPQHPLIASTLNDLAVLYVRHLGKYTEAESLYQQALQIFEQTLGLEDTHTRGIAGNYMFLLHMMGRETEALSLDARFPSPLSGG